MNWNQTLRTSLLILSLQPLGPVVTAQCTTANATSCACPGGGSACDLLPDMTISWYGLLNYLGGPNEQAGRIYVSGSTPNIGYGPMEIRGVDLNGYRRFVCGADTFAVYDPSAQQQFTCPNGGTAKQLTTQRIFHKNGSAMTSTEHVMPQGMTYHPSHGHTHFDQWGIYSLRLPETGVADPREWPIINQGYKLGFCLMDYNSCSDAAVSNHCKDDNTVYNAGTTLTGPSFPNFGLGGPYGCSMVRQGISSGYTDIYSEYLDGMWIDIPANTCNGDYWIVYEVDPLDVVVEADDDNNWTAVPITLAQQPSGSPQARIICDEQPFVCAGEVVELRANAGLSYQWSTGATTNSIMAGVGTYTVAVTTYCGTATSAPFTVTALSQPSPPIAAGVIICEGETAELTAIGGDPAWYDAFGDPVASGPTFTTPPLYATTTYQVADVNVQPGTILYGGKPDNGGAGAYHAGGQYLRFDALAAFRLGSVELYAGSGAVRTIELVDAVGVMRASRSAFVPAGQSRMELDFDIHPGNNYILTVSGTTDLWRSTSGVTYPYAIGTVANITGCSAGSTYYTYFYDWEVEVGGGSCASAMIPVVVEVEVCTGVDDALSLRGFEVYPNPNEGRFKVSLHLLRSAVVDLELSDMLGRTSIAERFSAPAGAVVREMDVSGLPGGIYTLTMRMEGRMFQRRVVVER
ncbi:MAG: T9SS type A sorting domain-containing protein [Flavobacteriales bacterium]|nr:T9SS type A sorting domain-containing protein [Flavobacteriales bacterium]